MKPGLLILPTIWRGCDWPAIILKWKDADGNPFNLTGWTPFAQTRTGISLNPVITNVAGGITQISLTHDQSGSMKLGVEQWDWVWWNNMPDGVKYPPIISGTVCVDEPTTRDFQSPT